MPTVFVTTPPEEARSIASALVEERLAACVNQLECHSTYRWEGEVVRDDEVILLAKTTVRGADELVDRVREIHPYDVPCIERFDEVDVLDEYADWIGDEVSDT